MVSVRSPRTPGAIPVLIAACFLAFPAHAKYSGGTGEPNDPYQIATAADLIALGETPADYDKHFILTDDIDLDPNLPSGRVFDRAVIAPTWETPFTGVFDGNTHTISYLTVMGGENLGLFGMLTSGAAVKNLGLVDVKITGSGSVVGGLVGGNGGSVTQCYSTGAVSGTGGAGGLVGGLVGYNWGVVAQCYSTGAVSGTGCVGGLVGYSEGGDVTQCYSTGAVSGTGGAGGLVGCNGAVVAQCYSTGSVAGTVHVGGLVGQNTGPIIDSYARGNVKGISSVGGLVGTNGDCSFTDCMPGGMISRCFWDTQTSGQTTSDGGIGKTTAEMQDPNTFMAAGWEFVGDGPHDIWAEPAGGGYPILWWQLSPLPELATFSGGAGEPDDPYRISTPSELNSIGHNPRLMAAHFELVNDIDLGDIDFYIIGSEFNPFTGSFNGNGHTISNLTITGGGYLGLFGRLAPGSEVRDLGVVDVNITSSDGHIGGLVGFNSGGTLANCYTSGVVNGTDNVGGLVGYDDGGHVTHCYSTAAVSGTDYVGGLVGYNHGSVTYCYTTAAVSGNSSIGGLVGSNSGALTQCYSISPVSGNSGIGGLVGGNSGALTQCYSISPASGNSSIGGLVGGNSGAVTQCYSTGAVSGRSSVGGLVGYKYGGSISSSFWDTQTSGQLTSAGGTGKTTGEMRTARTFLGWGGCGPLWAINEGRDYPHLAWENMPGDVIAGPIYGGGMGTAQDPYLIYTPEQLDTIGLAPCTWDKHFKLMSDIDLSGFDGKDGRPAFSIIGTYWNAFTGVFDGSGHTISHLTVMGEDYGGLFGQLASGAEVKDLGVVDVNITGSGHYVGGLVGRNKGSVTDCYSTGAVTGAEYVGGLAGCSEEKSVIEHCYNTGAVTGTERVGGLVGYNWGTVTRCYSTGPVRLTGTRYHSEGESVGGLVGSNGGVVAQCYSTGAVSGKNYVGGLVGENFQGVVAHSYSTGAVSGDDDVGGLVGRNAGSVTECHSTGAVRGTYDVGGLAGRNGGDVKQCYSVGTVSGTDYIGGLVGKNSGAVSRCFGAGQVNGVCYVGGLAGWSEKEGVIEHCYSSGAVRGTWGVGGLVGENYAAVTRCYSTGKVSGTGQYVGGLAGCSGSGAANCFWDTQTSGQATSAAGTGKTTVEMQTAATFLDAGWDFVGETANGTEDIWWILEGKDYPRLWWEPGDGASP